MKYSSAPSPNTSVRSSIASSTPLACSGAMNAGVPRTPDRVWRSLDTDTGSSPVDVGMSDAMPQSTR